MPGLKLYDDALLEKFQNWTQGTKMHIFGPNESRQVFETIIDESGKDKQIELPLIILSRPNGFTVNNPNKRPNTFDGMSKQSTVDLPNDPGKSIQLNTIPITINYQLDIYTRYMEEADELLRAFIFNIVNSPRVTILIPYQGLNIEHDSSLRMSPQVEDNSDIPERLITHQFFRNTINLEIDDAYLWDIKVRNNVIISQEDVLFEN